jgi:phospholipid/cholesterol/gamma-HCH transport system ATP-binding protein
MTESAEPVIAFRDVHLSFDRPILNGVDFELRRGVTKVVLGGSGSGKTTILRLILGLLKPDSGSIRVNGTEVAGLGEEELLPIRLNVGMVFQEGALFDSLTVGENVGYRLREDQHATPRLRSNRAREVRPEFTSGLTDDEIEARVLELLGFVGLGTLAGRMPSELSGGQRRRVALARALAARPQVMLYDEPTTGLDPITAKTITDLIVKVRDLDGVSSILVTHQLRDAFNVARTFVVPEGDDYVYRQEDDLQRLSGTEFLMLREGRVVFEGSPHALQTSTEPYIQEFLS